MCLAAGLGQGKVILLSWARPSKMTWHVGHWWEWGIPVLPPSLQTLRKCLILTECPSPSYLLGPLLLTTSSVFRAGVCHMLAPNVLHFGISCSIQMEWLTFPSYGVAESGLSTHTLQGSLLARRESLHHTYFQNQSKLQPASLLFCDTFSAHWRVLRGRVGGE